MVDTEGVVETEEVVDTEGVVETEEMVDSKEVVETKEVADYILHKWKSYKSSKFWCSNR